MIGKAYFIYIDGMFQSYEQYYIIFGKGWKKSKVPNIIVCINNQY